MYFLLILFFISLLGVIFMISRKLMLIQNGIIMPMGENHIGLSYIEEIKTLTIRNIKRYTYIALVNIIRFYVRSLNYVKTKYTELKSKMTEVSTRRLHSHTIENIEVSKFWKTVSEYKQKVREIKHRIDVEENQ